MSKQNIEDIYSLSSLQEGILFHSLSSPKSGVYVSQVCWQLDNSPNLSILKQAWQRVINRHSILRTAFYWKQRSEPFQVVYREAQLSWTEKDWRHIDLEKQQIFLEDFLKQDYQQGFDFSQPPLMRITTIQFADQQYQFVWTKHHLITDGWSTGLVLKEVFEAYKKLYNNQALSFQKSRPYGDFIAWLQQQCLSEAKAFWKQKLDGFSTPTPFTVDRNTKLNSTTKYNQKPGFQQQKNQLYESTTTTLQSLTKKYQLTLNTWLQGVFALLLSCYSGENDIIFGATSSGRSADLIGIESMVGPFINTLPVRVKVNSEEQFIPWLKTLQAQQTEALKYEHTPLVNIQSWSNFPRGMPLFESILVFENYPVDPSIAKESESLGISEFNTSESTNYPLTVAVGIGSQLSIQIGYDCQRFDDAIITQILKHFQNLLEETAANPERYLSNFSLLSDAERYKLLVKWNETKTEFPQHKCIHQLFEEQVEQTPDAIALVHQNQQLTYRELNARANQLAHYLQCLGVQPETLVGICMEQSLERIIALLGIVKAGGAYVPFDPSYPKERIRRICTEADVLLLLTQSNLSQALSDVFSGDIILLDQQRETITQQPQDNTINSRPLEHLAYVIYTSGSTGQPKGVSVCERGVLNLVFWHQSSFGVTRSTRATQLASIAFDASAWEIWPYLTAGASLYLVDREHLTSSVQLKNWLLSREIEITFVPTPLAESFFSLSWPHQAALRTLLTGGDRLNQFPPPSLPFQLVNNYGPTENTVVTSSGIITPSKDQERLPGMGSAISNTNLYVLDRNLQPVPMGVPGELYIGSVSLARGYLHSPALTAETFIPNPFSMDAGARLYRTGDLVRYRREGSIEFLGRIDNQIKIRGFRIERGEIETTLNLHPEVVQSAVTTWDRAGNQQLVAYIVPQLEQSPNTQELQSFLKEKLPSYMIPAAFVILEEMPLTSNGKVNHQALPDPGTAKFEQSNTFVAPRNALERNLCDIWCQILELEQVGIHDNFFDLGGHSLLITQLLAQVRKAFQIDLPLRSLLEAPTVAELAEKIELAREGNASAKTSVDPVEALRNDTILDPNIYPDPGPQNIEHEPTNILLTGATGFLGAFLLNELLQQTRADIYCLIRSSHAEAGKQKIQTSLQSYSTWDESFSSRIIPLIGDLSQALFSLSQQQFEAIASKIDVIYHNGAWVHHTYPYSTLKAANVSGTQEILRLASYVKTKPVHFISTVSVFSPDNASGVKLVREQDSPDQGPVPSSGYAQSKWVAERLVAIAQERGIPACIYRPGRVSGHSETGVFNENDFLYRLIIGCIQLGMAPAGEMELNLAPVDYVSRALVYLSQQNASYGKAFHLVNPSSFTTSQLIEYLHTLGYPIQQVPYKQWQAKLLEIAGDSPDHPLYPLVPLFPSKETQPTDNAHLQFDCQNVQEDLANTSITCPAIADRLLPVYVSHLIDRGFIKPPQTPVQKTT
jgi:amino acid adenylation domain-containing protein/thioester reductase-like protein